MVQDKTFWLKQLDNKALKYHERQFKTPNRSTVFFSDFLKSLKLLSEKDSKNLLDIGSGEGASLSYMGYRFPKSNFTGVDINKFLVKKGNSYFSKTKQSNCKLEVGDLYDLDKKYRNNFDGIISLQTLSWLPDYVSAIKQMIKLNPKWIVISSLFYEGLIECEIKVWDYTGRSGKRPKEAFYNIYSLELIKKLFNKYGYKKFKYRPFIIDIDIEKNKEGGMGTYTVKKENAERLQISGPLLMNWYFIAAERT